MSGLNPTTLSVRHLREVEKWPLVAVAEYYNAFTKRRHDLFGILDLVAVGPKGTLGVQTTSAANVSSRVRKITESPALDPLLEAGWLIVVHGWRKRSGRWELHRCIELHETPEVTA